MEWLEELKKYQVSFAFPYSFLLAHWAHPPFQQDGHLNFVLLWLLQSITDPAHLRKNLSSLLLPKC